MSQTYMAGMSECPDSIQSAVRNTACFLDNETVSITKETNGFSWRITNTNGVWLFDLIGVEA